MLFCNCWCKYDKNWVKSQSSEYTMKQNSFCFCSDVWSFFLLIFTPGVKGVVLRGFYKRMIGTKFKTKLNLKGFWGHTVCFGQMYLISWAVFGNSVWSPFWSVIRPAAILTCQTVKKLRLGEEEEKTIISKPKVRVAEIWVTSSSINPLI